MSFGEKETTASGAGPETEAALEQRQQGQREKRWTGNFKAERRAERWKERRGGEVDGRRGGGVEK